MAAQEKQSVATGELVSVVLPVFNAAAYLDAALASILDQTHHALELLVVVDEGSSDASAAIVEALASRDPRVIPISMPHDTPNAARLKAARQARGAYIAFMDADDISPPNRIAEQLAYVRLHDLAICGCQIERFGRAPGPMWFPESHEAIVHEQLFRFALFTPALMMRADVLTRFDGASQRFWEDHEWWSILVESVRTANVPAVLYRWRSHDGNASKHRTEELLGEWRRGREWSFFRLFPEATRADFDAFNRLVEKRPYGSPGELDRAGRWLARLADVPELKYRNLQARRWQRTCMQSAHLGPQVHRLFRDHRGQFGTSTSGAMKVFVLSHLRLSSDSLLYQYATWPMRSIRALARRAAGWMR